MNGMTDHNDNDERPTTQKITNLPPVMNEKEYAQYLYDEALKAMLENPNDIEKVNAFTEANRRLYEVQDSYRIGGRLLIERNKEAERAFSRKIVADHLARSNRRMSPIKRIVMFFKQL